MTASEKQPLLGNPICSAQQRRIWHWHIWCKLMNRSAASDLCSLDICPFLLWWIGARSTDGETAEDWDQDPEGGWLREGCCHLKPSQEVRKNGCLCSASHYCISTSSIRHGSADPCETHTCCRLADTVKPVGTSYTAATEKGDDERIGGLAKLCCLLADELSAHWHVGYALSMQWALPQLLWQCRNSCLWVENGVAVEGSAGQGAEERLSYMSNSVFQTRTHYSVCISA